MTSQMTTKGGGPGYEGNGGGEGAGAQGSRAGTNWAGEEGVGII